ncbi:MAG: hypothetical protein O9296_11640 [Novosphingobium sp.]|jgi:hypothetical protein|nr:hypothetical protein [Novosphingobium sp.]
MSNCIELFSRNLYGAVIAVIALIYLVLRLRNLLLGRRQARSEKASRSFVEASEIGLTGLLILMLALLSVHCLV